MRYPRDVYNIREATTRNNMKEYDRKKEIFYKKCEEIDPDYWKRSLRERMAIRDKAEEILGYRIQEAITMKDVDKMTNDELTTELRNLHVKIRWCKNYKHFDLLKTVKARQKEIENEILKRIH